MNTDNGIVKIENSDLDRKFNLNNINASDLVDVTELWVPYEVLCARDCWELSWFVTLAAKMKKPKIVFYFDE